MAANEGELKPLDLENTRADQEQEDLKRAAQTDKVVRGVNGSLVPSARKLRPAGGHHHHRYCRAGGTIHARGHGDS